MDHLMIVKREINDSRRRVIISVAAGLSEGSDGVKRIKRRRREPALAPTASDGKREATAQQSPISNTIERSSRFREVTDYEKEIQIMQNVTKEEYLASLRRKSSGFSRGVSKYIGVARLTMPKLISGTQEEAAHAYDIAAIEYRGINAVTNFDLNTYIRWLRPRQLQAIPQPSNLFLQTSRSII